MPRIYSDTEKLLKAAELSKTGHHTQAAGIYQAMGNEVRKPSEKDALWKLASDAKKRGE